MGFQGNNNGVAPVKEGEEYDVRIDAVGEKGDGVARIKGFVVFVPSVKEGDEVRVKITKVLKKVGFAENIGKPSRPVSKPKARQAVRLPPKREVEPELSAEEKAMFDTSKDSEDFGDDESDSSEVVTESEPTEKEESENDSSKVVAESNESEPVKKKESENTIEEKDKKSVDWDKDPDKKK